MTNNQFETLAQMIKGVHNDVDDLRGEMLEHFQKVFAHLTAHDRDLSMIKKEMMDMGRTLKGLAGLETEVIETKRRVTRIEKRLDIPTVGFK